MKWINVSPRDYGRVQDDSHWRCAGRHLDIHVRRRGDVVWYLDCHALNMHVVLQALNHRDAKIEAIGIVSTKLENLMAELNKAKTARVS